MELNALLGQNVHVVIDRPVGYRHKGLVYPVNYGYIPGTTAGDGEEQDAYVLGVDKPIAHFDGTVIGIIRRHNDVEDKLVVAPEGLILHQGQIMEAVHFQEQYFDCSIDCLLRKSCGVIPYRISGETPQFLLLHQTFSKTWSFPKGHMEPGETEEQTASREFFEETGMKTELIQGKRAVLEYPVSPVSQKQVVMFIGQVTGEPVIDGREIDSYRWVTAQELQNYLLPETCEACMPLIAYIEQR